MKKLFIVLLSFLSSKHLCAQKIADKNLLSLSIGSSIPVLHFGNASNSPGYAKVGGSVSISFTHQMNKQIGITAMLYAQTNRLNSDVLATQFEKTSFFGNAGLGSPRQYSNWAVQKKNWQMQSFLIGITNAIPSRKNSKTVFTVKTLIGIAHVQYPALNATSISDTAYVTANQTGASAFGFGYMVGIGVKYKLNKRLRLFLNCDYAGTSQIRFKNIISTTTATNGGLTIPNIYSFANSVGPILIDINKADTKKEVTVVNAGIGIGVIL